MNFEFGRIAHHGGGYVNDPDDPGEDAKMLTFDQMFDRIVGHEGGYVNDPDDPGGETKFGISKRSYPNVDIKNLTVDQAKVLWKRDFWTPVASTVPDVAVAYQVCDAAYNHGFGNAVRILQRAVDTADDGHWGPASRRAYHGFSVNDTLFRFLAFRIRFFTKLVKFKKYGAGWMNRIAENLLYAALDNPD